MSIIFLTVCLLNWSIERTLGLLTFVPGFGFSLPSLLFALNPIVLNRGGFFLSSSQNGECNDAYLPHPGVIEQNSLSVNP